MNPRFVPTISFSHDCLKYLGRQLKSLTFFKAQHEAALNCNRTASWPRCRDARSLCG